MSDILRSVRAVDIIAKKRDGAQLSRAEISCFVDGVTCGTWPDYQTAALLMAIVLRGMTVEETAALTDAMARSGAQADLRAIRGIKVDKHSTGGVGDKTSLVLAPAAAACGVIVPMMSGRGLGHTGGTLDKLESIPGFRVRLSLEEMNAALARVGCAMIGQTGDIAPADKKLYALRDVTGTVESIPLITASILSKKIAEGIDALVIDVKAGSGAFMKTEPDARRLASSLVQIAKTSGLKTVALITAMDAPLGHAVGNALEVAECLQVMRGGGPPDLVGVTIELTARVLVLGGAAPTIAAARARASDAIASGRALEKFRAIVDAQGGDVRVIDDPRRLPQASRRHVITAPRAGFVARVDAGAVGRAAVLLGAGRSTLDDSIDPAAGVVVHVKPGDRLELAQPAFELHFNDNRGLEAARLTLAAALDIVDGPPPPTPLIIGEVTDAGAP